MAVVGPEFRMITFGVVITGLSIINESIQICYPNIPNMIIDEWLNRSVVLQNGTLPSPGHMAGIYGVFISVLAFGGILGSLVAAPMADRYGRKFAVFYLSNIVCLVGTALSVWAYYITNFHLLTFSRFLQGVSVAIHLHSCPVYLSECGSKHIRGILGGMRGPMGFAAATLVNAVAFPQVFGNEKLFVLLLISPAPFAIILMAIGPCSPESPKYLYARNGDLAQIDHVMRHLYDNASEMVDLSDAAEQQKPYTLRECLRHKVVRRGIAGGAVVACMRGFTGTPIIVIFAARVMREGIGLSTSTVNLLVVLPAILGTFLAVVGVFVIHKLGRRSAVLGGGTGHVLCWIGYIVVQIIRQHHDSEALKGLSVLLLLVQIIVIYPIATGTVPYFLSSELVATHARPTASGVAMVAFWVSLLIVTLSYPLLESLISVYAILVIVIAPLIACLVYVYFGVPETKGRTIAEITDFFDR